MITADQASEISLNSISNEDKLLLEEIFNLIEQEAKLGKFQAVYKTIGSIMAGPTYITRELESYGFRVSRGLVKEGYTFLIEWY